MMRRSRVITALNQRIQTPGAVHVKTRLSIFWTFFVRYWTQDHGGLRFFRLRGHSRASLKGTF